MNEHLELIRDKMDDAASDENLSREDYRNLLEALRDEATMRIQALDEDGD